VVASAEGGLRHLTSNGGANSGGASDDGASPNDDGANPSDGGANPSDGGGANPNDVSPPARYSKSTLPRKFNVGSIPSPSGKASFSDALPVSKMWRPASPHQ
jgi:hypothetical protein